MPEQIHKVPGNYKSVICRLAYFLKNLDLYPDFFYGRDMKEVKAKIICLGGSLQTLVAGYQTWGKEARGQKATAFSLFIWISALENCSKLIKKKKANKLSWRFFYHHLLKQQNYISKNTNIFLFSPFSVRNYSVVYKHGNNLSSWAQ